jgi:hypothetical protein
MPLLRIHAIAPGFFSFSTRRLTAWRIHSTFRGLAQRHIIQRLYSGKFRREAVLVLVNGLNSADYRAVYGTG